MIFSSILKKTMNTRLHRFVAVDANLGIELSVLNIRRQDTIERHLQKLENMHQNMLRFLKNDFTSAASLMLITPIIFPQIGITQ